MIHDDILKVNLKELMNKNLKGTIQQVKIVANLPYYITTPIIMKLLERNPIFHTQQFVAKFNEDKSSDNEDYLPLQCILGFQTEGIVVLNKKRNGYV